MLSTYGSDAITPIVLLPDMVYANLWALRHSYSFRSVTTCLMQYNEQPVDSAATLPTSEVPQGQLTSYNHNDIWLYTGAAFAPDKRTNDHEWDQLFTAVLNAAAVESPTAFTGGSFDNALGFDDLPDLYPSFTTPPFSEGSGLSTSGSTDSSTFLTAPIPTHWDAVTIRGLLYAKEMTFRERMARLQSSVTSPMTRRGRIRKIT